MGAVVWAVLSAGFVECEAEPSVLAFHADGHRCLLQCFGVFVVDECIECIERSVSDLENGRYGRFVFRDGRLRGAILLGDTKAAAPAKTAIENQTDLSALLSKHPTGKDVIQELTER